MTRAAEVGGHSAHGQGHVVGRQVTRARRRQSHRVGGGDTEVQRDTVNHFLEQRKRTEKSGSFWGECKGTLWILF